MWTDISSLPVIYIASLIQLSPRALSESTWVFAVKFLKIKSPGIACRLSMSTWNCPNPALVSSSCIENNHLSWPWSKVMRKLTQKSEKRPVYVLNITIAPKDVDNCLEPTKSSIQLQVRGLSYCNCNTLWQRSWCTELRVRDAITFVCYHSVPGTTWVSVGTCPTLFGTRTSGHATAQETESSS